MKPQTMLEMLQKYAPARERRNKNSATAYFIKQKFPELKDMDVDKIANMVAMANSLDREWRKITETHTYLRGSDYNQKYILVKNKQRELGYT